jgi:hypothetical protein
MYVKLDLLWYPLTMLVVLSINGVGVLDVMAAAMWLCYSASSVYIVLWLWSLVEFNFIVC